MEIYNGMSGKELSDWRRTNRERAIEKMKKEAALHPVPDITQEERKAAHEMIQT